MWPSFINRRNKWGSSFTQCLLTCVVVFGGIGFWYFNYFQWRHFDAPLEGLTYVKGGAAPQLNSFRKATTAKVIDTIERQNNRLKEIRKALKKKKGGFEEYTDFQQDCKEVRNRLLEIMSEARLRRIPQKFKKRYSDCLLALVDTYQSVVVLQDMFNAETPKGKEDAYKASIKHSKKAKKKLDRARQYFHGSKDWAN